MLDITYNPYFRNLVRGRQQEFLVYSELYRASEELFGKIRLNIYDQITDIDGIDFLLRCEGPDRLLYFEGQVKKTGKRLLFNDSLRQLVARSLAVDARLLVFAVEYSHAARLPSGVYFYTAEELDRAQRAVGRSSFTSKELCDILERDTSIGALADYLLERVGAS